MKGLADRPFVLDVIDCKQDEVDNDIKKPWFCPIARTTDSPQLASN